MPKRKHPTASTRRHDNRIPFDPSECLDDGHLVFSGEEGDFDNGNIKDMITQGFICLEEMCDLNSELAQKKTKQEPKERKQRHTLQKPTLPPPPKSEAFSPIADMSAWDGLGVPEEVLSRLAHAGFVKPTEIQVGVLQALAIANNKDLLGVAPTGSGKTLAFGISLVTRSICQHNHFYLALVLVPTRELAIQIKDHLEVIGANVCAVVGGLAKEKQQRLLSYAPSVIVATPGRLQELLEDDDVLYGDEASLRSILKTRLDTLVLDEADRLLEAGHFRDLNAILSLIASDGRHPQMMLFSATLLSEKNRSTYAKKLKLVDTATVRAGQTAPKSLHQGKVLTDDRDCALFAWLWLHKQEKTIVFVNSIAMLKRLLPMLNLLQLSTTALHAQMHQRQRLKHLERFQNGTCNVLLATDVIGRGIDLPMVDTVVHYQVPLSRDAFIHRSGRAGRAERSGLSILILQDDQDVKAAKKIAVDPPILDAFSYTLMEDCIPMVSMARSIESECHKRAQSIKERTWQAKTSADAEVFEENEDDDDSSGDERMLDKHARVQLERAKRQLESVLKTLPVGPPA